MRPEEARLCGSDERVPRGDVYTSCVRLHQKICVHGGYGELAGQLVTARTCGPKSLFNFHW